MPLSSVPNLHPPVTRATFTKCLETASTAIYKWTQIMVSNSACWEWIHDVRLYPRSAAASPGLQSQLYEKIYHDTLALYAL
jgi:hypothetical protein